MEMANRNLKKWIKRSVLTIAGIFILLAGVLAWHIYKVSNRSKGGVEGWQMARIDFRQSLDSSQIQTIRNTLHSFEGIHHSIMNMPEGILVYAFDPAVQTASEVHAQLVKSTGYTAEKFVVDAADMAGACPIVDKNSISYRISSGFQKLFK
jgi:hypothetical protein